IVTGDSPTQEVGGDAVFSPVEHPSQMYSLEDVFSLSELEEWFQRIGGGLARIGVEDGVNWLAEVKIDGLPSTLCTATARYFGLSPVVTAGSAKMLPVTF